MSVPVAPLHTPVTRSEVPEVLSDNRGGPPVGPVSDYWAQLPSPQTRQLRPVSPLRGPPPPTEEKHPTPCPSTSSHKSLKMTVSNLNLNTFALARNPHLRRAFRLFQIILAAAFFRLCIYTTNNVKLNVHVGGNIDGTPAEPAFLLTRRGNWSFARWENVSMTEVGEEETTLLVASIIPDSTSYGTSRNFTSHLQTLTSLTHPPHLTSLALLVLDPLEHSTILSSLKSLSPYFSHITIIRQHDAPPPLPRDRRHDGELQFDRRGNIAMARNALVVHALKEEDFVLFVDADVGGIGEGTVGKMLESGKDILTIRSVGEKCEDCDS
ncbi:Anp1-domain-containing protein [Blyttiomyces helicus]|uniref:Anp1-domain-containing protein n=1 Tax=Blyttiomyces helicus TaxID=388810 RepID=A0A4P9WA06_9FUNG|nr:Anp1-domain-containing protein [Blyttiomyces helicus]|eukprot:RKO89399.1 Anp1-domain-containing protein [Blyttiomyces helicus]